MTKTNILIFFAIAGLTFGLKAQDKLNLKWGTIEPGDFVLPESDLEACNRLCRQIHGHDREGELRDAIKQGTAKVVEHLGRITGYATDIGIFAHAVGETNQDIKALIAGAPEIGGGGLLLPTRNGELFRWCLQNGLRLVHQMTLMTIGLYNEPAGAYLPSVLY